MLNLRLSEKVRPKHPDLQQAILWIYATVALTLDYYYRFDARIGLIFYLLLPMAMLVVFRRPLKLYGVTLGDWRRGLLLTVGGWLLMAPILWVVARGPAFVAYYARFWRMRGAWGTIWWAALDLLSWEFFFRGFLLFSLAEMMGRWAVLFQAFFFTFGHFSKPELETLSCIVGGSAFGWVAWKTDSFLYPFLIHWFVTVFTIWVTTLP